MPFKSDKQRRWMFANHPAIARRWARHSNTTGTRRKHRGKRGRRRGR